MLVATGLASAAVERRKASAPAKQTSDADRVHLSAWRAPRPKRRRAARIALPRLRLRGHWLDAPFGAPLPFDCRKRILKESF